MQSTRDLGALVLAGAMLLACGGPGGDRVLIVGIDGATMRVIRPLMEEGRLPHLSNLAEQGVASRLRSQLPLISPRIWTSIATGKTPEKHGILNFAVPGEGDRAARLFLSSDRTTRALWNIASDADLSVAVVNWWNTYPPEAVNGVIVSDHVLPAEIAGRRRLTGSESAKRGPVTHPADWMERVTDALKDGRALTSVEDPFRADGADGLPDFVDRGKLSRQYRADQSVTRIALAAEQELRPDLLMVFLPGIDRVSHMLWGAIEAESDYEGPPLTDEERRAAAQALYRYYEFTDGLIGSLVERYGDDDLVLVVSDHGFESGSTLDNTTGVHITRKALHGVIFARGRGIATPSEGRLPRILDVTPTVLAWLGLPVGEDMDGRVATFLHGVEVQRIASHDTSTVERPGALPSGAEEQILEDLRALGYFEEPADE